jgi:hypothetical protein
MKWIRISALAGVTLGLLALAVFWSLPPAGFATPAACLEAYREASRAGNVPAYLSCLAEPLRAEIRRQHTDPKKLADSLRQAMKDVKTWVQLPVEASQGPTVQVNVDEVRITGNHRLGFHLRRCQTGWLIVGIDPPKLVPAGIPYGTHVSKVPEETQEKPQP